MFAEANVQAGYVAYRLFVATSAPGPICSSSGVQLMPDSIIGRDFDEAINTLLVAGCPNAAEVPAQGGVVEWLRCRAPLTRRFGPVCSGAFFLAAAGLLDGRRVATHWAAADALAKRFALVIVDADAIHIRDGQLRAAAGVTADLDLALALVEEDLGREIAMRVASRLVMFFKRAESQMQFSRKGEATPTGRAALQELQRWVTAIPAINHSVASPAKRMEFSPRHFARLFRSEVGISPATWVEAARVSAARHLLEQGHETPKQVAARCGFADADTLRRAFARHVAVSPAEYRKRFAGIAA